MYRHYIIMSSAYCIGSRIALDYIINSVKDFGIVQKDLEYIENHKENDLHLSSHSIQTDTPEWEAVVEKDGFFKGVKVINNKKEFINLINKDKDLSGLEVAKYILTKIPCTHLKLEKLVYLSYADYLCNTGEQLFHDQIFAYKLGPIISTVYKKYKKKKEKIIEVEDDEIIEDETKLFNPLRSRIMSSKNGLKKVFSIDKTIEKYGNMEAFELVEITHKDKSPWRMSGGFKLHPRKINDDKIKQYHKYEEVIYE